MTLVCKPYFSTHSQLLQLWMLCSTTLPSSWQANTVHSLHKGMIFKMKVNQISQLLLSRSLKYMLIDTEKDPEKYGDTGPVLQELTSSEYWSCWCWCSDSSFISHLYKMAANYVSQYVISPKGEMQNIVVADVRERGVYFAFDDQGDFMKEARLHTDVA